MTVGKNKPLHAEKPKWKSETPLTMGQLRSKRDEYWETQPAFEGRQEIWDALRAACETDDIALAQAIINGANITLPTGIMYNIGNTSKSVCIEALSILVLPVENLTTKLQRSVYFQIPMKQF